MIPFFSSTRIFYVALSASLLVACGGSETDSAPQSIASSSPAPAPTQVVKAKIDPLARGAKLYKRCSTCHTLEKDGRHKVGPNMWDIYGATAGMKEGFAYSKAMKESGVVWTDETLDAYIANPRKYMPGNRMSYVGLRKAEDRAAVLAYIKAETTPKN
jgi:cytochrome c